MSRTKPGGVTSESAGSGNEICRVCLGSDTYAERRVSYPFKFGARVVIFENVPALVCSQCGESVLGAETAKLIDKLGRGERPPSRVEQVPVFDLAEVT